jgi:hypothetical protein
MEGFHSEVTASFSVMQALAALGLPQKATIADP